MPDGLPWIFFSPYIARLNNVFLSSLVLKSEEIEAAVATHKALEEPKPEPRGIPESTVIDNGLFSPRYSRVLLRTI